jgi:PIN domain nuclease of toxin-antitoxin system
MMRLLLDTHIWLWSTLQPHKLTSDVHSTITDPSNACYLSPVSIWEVITLLEKKRIGIDRDFCQWFAQSRVDFALQEAPLDWKVAHEMRFLMLGYKDPADRLLAATARAYDMTLVTADQRLLRIPGVKTLGNL